MSHRTVVVDRPGSGPFAGVRALPGLVRSVFGAGGRTLALATAERSGAPDGDADANAPEGGMPGSEAEGARPGAPSVLEECLAALAARGLEVAAQPAVAPAGDARAFIARAGAGEARELLAWLRDEAPIRFDVLYDFSLVDRLPAVPRFEADYTLHSSDRRPELAALSLRLRVALAFDPTAPESLELDSVAALFRSADWLEREAAELFGVRFRGHPGLQPLLLEPGFVGAPLRRDFTAAAFDEAALAAGSAEGLAPATESALPVTA